MRALTRIAVLALLLGGTGGAAACARPATHTVTIDGTRFEPAELAVAPGDTIVWVNKDPFPHTVTSAAGAFDSGPVQPGASWQYRAESSGVFAYICSLHPTMQGTLRVK